MQNVVEFKEEVHEKHLLITEAANNKWKTDVIYGEKGSLLTVTKLD
jgi:hypothetical protein